MNHTGLKNTEKFYEGKSAYSAWKFKNSKQKTNKFLKP